MIIKKTNEDELNFVVKHYKECRIDEETAWKKFKKLSATKRSRNTWKSISVAASVLIITSVAIACILLRYNPIKPIQQAPNNMVNPLDTIPIKQNKDSVKVFKFNKKPIRDVLNELSAYYTKTLTTADSTKVLSGEIEATSLEEVIGIIENTLDIKITVK